MSMAKPQDIRNSTTVDVGYYPGLNVIWWNRSSHEKTMTFPPTVLRKNKDKSR